jgi:hypothetical protein
MDLRQTAITLWIASSIGLLAIIVTLIAHAQPEINSPNKKFRYVPNTQPTGIPFTPTRIDKTSLIMQQNVNCWLAVVGATCGLERTYL